MPFLRRFYLLIFIVLFDLSIVHATHIVGGELTYRCLGGQLFEITLTVYRDCFNGRPQFDDPAIIGVYKTGTDSLFNKRLMPYDEQTNDTIPVVLQNPCLVAPPNICVHRAIYRDTLELPFRQDGYTIVYQRCCRNRLIRNIPNPLNTGISFIAQINAQVLSDCNSAATFNNWPPVAICVHQPIDFDHSASDTDGDSLAYRLCTPLNGPDSLNAIPNPPEAPPYVPLEWINPPYSLDNLLGGTPLTIDPQTGWMTGVPNTIGNFVVGVCVDEFRGGVLLSTTRRDFQYNVADCGQPTAAFFVPGTICDTLTVQFENQSLFTNSFNWYFDWPDDLGATSSVKNPVYTYSDTGLYQVALIAAPNTVCADTFVFDLHLVETISDLTAVANPESIDRGETSQLSAMWEGAIQYQWTPAGTLDGANTQSPLATPLETTTYTVIATLPNGCQQSAETIVRVNPPVCGPPFVFFPTGFSPNGDGENDVLKLESNITVSVYWAIFDRWGEKVFEANTLEDSWDGTFRGEAMPAETYGYQLRVRCADGQEWYKKGNVTLLR